MKKENRNNLAGLAILHLLLLAYPLINKLVHVHNGAHYPHEFLSEKIIVPGEDDCPVCNFEFYNFISNITEHCFEAKSIVNLYIDPIPQIIFTSFIHYFSRRAPPLA